MTAPLNSPHPHHSTIWKVHPVERRAILVIGDMIVAIIALIAGLILWAEKDPYLLQFSLEFLSKRVDFWFYLLPIVWLVLLANLYDIHYSSSWKKTLLGLVGAAFIGLVIYSLVYLFSPKGSLTRWGVGYFLVIAAALTGIWRLTYIKIFTAPAFMRRVLIVGAGKAGRTLVTAYKSLWPPPFYVAGFIDDDPVKAGKQLEGFQILGNSDQMLEIIEREDISDLVIAITGEMQGSAFQTILDAQENGLEVIPMPTLYEDLFRRVPVHHLESEWLIRSFVDSARKKGFYEIAKRVIDIFGGLVGVGIWLAAYPLVAIATALDTGFPIMYKQIRSGKSGRPYMMGKFRTMRQDAERDGKVQLTKENDERITRIGILLRRTHIDELPQFWNVLRGEMSLVGPRAERPEWVAEFQKQIPFYRARLLVKPGVTGLAQVSYSYYATVEEMATKLEYDLYYIKHRDLPMDLTILLRTIWQVFGFRGR